MEIKHIIVFDFILIIALGVNGCAKVESFFSETKNGLEQKYDEQYVRPMQYKIINAFKEEDYALILKLFPSEYRTKDILADIKNMGEKIDGRISKWEPGFEDVVIRDREDRKIVREMERFDIQYILPQIERIDCCVHGIQHILNILSLKVLCKLF